MQLKLRWEISELRSGKDGLKIRGENAKLLFLGF
jgi:hypothetical protein